MTQQLTVRDTVRSSYGVNISLSSDERREVHRIPRQFWNIGHLSMYYSRLIQTSSSGFHLGLSAFVSLISAFTHVSTVLHPWNLPLITIQFYFFSPWVNLALERATFFSVQKYIRIIRGHFIDSFSPLTNSWIDATSLF